MTIEYAKQVYDEASLEVLRDYILSKKSKEYQDLLLACERLLENIFLFEDNWDMEPCPVAYQLSPMDWQANCHGDEEWTFMLNRQEYLWKLALAFLVEQDERYLAKVRELMMSWVEQVRDWHPKAASSRTLDTALRCLTWLKLLPILTQWKGLTELEYRRILESIQQQLVYLRIHYRPKDLLSNWGIFQTGAMLLAHAYLGHEIDIEAEYEFACGEIERQIDTQILEDGTQYEQSFLYHVEVYKLLLELAYLLPEYREPWSPVLRKMANYVVQMTGPDGRSLAIGDSDCHETTDILQLTALFFEDGAYLPDASAGLDLHLLLLVGQKGLERFERLETGVVATGGSFFSNSGHSIVKERDSYLFFKSGPMGSGHSHGDQNSFCFYHKGKPVVIDSGRYSYRECKERYMLKSSWAHSSCILNEQSAEQVSGSWEFDSYPQFISHDYHQVASCYWMQGVYQATTRGGLPYWHRRQVVMAGADVLLIVDQLDCQGEHSLTSQLILDPQVVVGQETINDLCLYSSQVFIPQEAVVSPKYNELNKTQKLVKKEFFKDRIISYTLLVEKEIDVEQVPIHQTDQTLLKNGLAFSCQGKGVDILLVLHHQDIYKGEKLIQVEGYPLRGKCLVVDRKTGQIIRLRH